MSAACSKTVCPRLTYDYRRSKMQTGKRSSRQPGKLLLSSTTVCAASASGRTETSDCPHAPRLDPSSSIHHQEKHVFAITIYLVHDISTVAEKTPMKNPTLPSSFHDQSKYFQKSNHNNVFPSRDKIKTLLLLKHICSLSCQLISPSLTSHEQSKITLELN